MAQRTYPGHVWELDVDPLQPQVSSEEGDEAAAGGVGTRDKPGGKGTTTKLRYRASLHVAMLIDLAEDVYAGVLDQQ